MSKEKELPNVEAVTQFRLKGKPVVVGEVVSKKDFPQKADWQNLVHMEPARCAETDKPVGKPGAKKPAAKKPAAKKPADKKDEGAKLPGADE